MYTIDENAAKAAHDANHFGDYNTGNATAAYRQMVEDVRALGEQQKQRVDARYHDKIDYYVDLYERKLAANINQGNRIAAKVPSVMISGRGNFPTARKEKQVAQMDRNMEDFQKIDRIKQKILSIGMGGVSADDKDAVTKLQKKLENCQRSQDLMKAVNAYYRKHKTLDGCDLLPQERIEEINTDLASAYMPENAKPFPSYALSNNNAEIRRLRRRIEELEAAKTAEYDEWTFDGGEIVANRDINRLQILFDERPDEGLRDALKTHGFKWSPKENAWQRQLNNNAYIAVRSIPALLPQT